MIELQKICKTYGMDGNQVLALRDVDLTINKGEFISIMGPSGSGKSTLMNIIGCLDQPTSGSYKLNDEEVTELDDNDLAMFRSRTIGFVFQSYNLLARTTAIENVELPMIYAGLPNRFERAIKALERVGLMDRAYHKPNELSGGQQQRVAIARAIVHNPEIILADEPTGNLDTQSGNEIMKLFKELHDEGQTVVIVTHDVEIGAMTDRILRFRDGFLVSDEKNENPEYPWNSIEV